MILESSRQRRRETPIDKKYIFEGVDTGTKQRLILRDEKLSKQIKKGGEVNMIMPSENEPRGSKSGGDWETDTEHAVSHVMAVIADDDGACDTVGCFLMFLLMDVYGFSADKSMMIGKMVDEGINVCIDHEEED